VGTLEGGTRVESFDRPCLVFLSFGFEFFVFFGVRFVLGRLIELGGAVDVRLVDWRYIWIGYLVLLDR
jgi:hypothetical protein